jgi:hypothetical protein
MAGTLGAIVAACNSWSIFRPQLVDAPVRGC